MHVIAHQYPSLCFKPSGSLCILGRDFQVQASRVMKHLELTLEASKRSRIQEMVQGLAGFIEDKPTSIEGRLNEDSLAQISRI